MRPLAAKASATLGFDVIDRSTGLGRGLVARRAHAAGELLARERPLAMADAAGTTAAVGAPSPVRTLAAAAAAPEHLLIIDLLLLQRSSVEGAALVEDLPPGPRHWLTLPATRPCLLERCAAVQGLLREARARGASSCPDVSDDEVVRADLRRIGCCAAQWREPCLVPAALALLNHSCSPNCALQWDSSRGEVLLRSILPIAAGAELLVSYVNEEDHVLSRRYHLLEKQGFLCLCSRCQNNFDGLVCAPSGGWRCRICQAVVADEALECPACRTPVVAAGRAAREAALAQAAQLAMRAGIAGRSGDPPLSAELLAEALDAMRALRPTTDPQLGCWLLARRSMLLATSKGATSALALAQVDAELQEHRLAVRAAICAEAAPRPQPALTAEDSAWQARLLRALRLHEPSGQAGSRGRKRRVGSRGDGGYVVWDDGLEPLCVAVLSYGVDTNVDFEMELASYGAKVLMFDHTVAAPSRRHPRAAFCREALAAHCAEGVCGTLSAHLARLAPVPGARVLLKLDVEGAEFDAILCTPPEVLARFSQICIELHWLARPSRGGDFRTKALALERLAEHFVILHAHANNYGDVLEVGGVAVPDVLEALYVNRKLLGPGGCQPSSRGLAPVLGLDVQNCAFVEDIAMQSPPFGGDIPGE